MLGNGRSAEPAAGLRGFQRAPYRGSVSRPSQDQRSPRMTSALRSAVASDCRCARATLVARAKSFEQFGDVVAVDPQTAPISQGRYELAVLIEQPSRIDRGYVRHATVAIESDGVSLRRLLCRLALLVAGGREVQDVAGRLIRAGEVKIVGGNVNRGGRHLRWGRARWKRP